MEKKLGDWQKPVGKEIKMGINNVTLVGRLTKDPDLRYTPNGVAVATFTVAVNRPYKDNQADFINCVVWKKPAENVANYTKKGSLVGVTGMIQTRNYENKQGQRVFVTEVLATNVRFLEKRQDQGGQQQSSPYQNQGQQSNPYQSDPFADDGQPVNISDEDLPF